MDAEHAFFPGYLDAGRYNGKQIEYKMISSYMKLLGLFAGICLAVLPGCMFVHKQPALSVPEIPVHEFDKKMEELTEKGEENEDPLHDVRMGILLSHHNNPSPDYKKAYELFHSALPKVQDQDIRQDLLSRMHLIREIMERDKSLEAFTITMETNTLEEEIAYTEYKRLSQEENHSHDGILLKLALLYSHPENPSPDYSRACRYMEEYVSVCPEHPRKNELLKYLFIFRELEHSHIMICEQEKTFSEKMKKLEKEKNLLEIMKKKHLLEIRRMKETIEGLKKLDMRIERQRKAFE